MTAYFKNKVHGAYISIACVIILSVFQAIFGYVRNDTQLKRAGASMYASILVATDFVRETSVSTVTYLMAILMPLFLISQSKSNRYVTAKKLSKYIFVAIPFLTIFHLIGGIFTLSVIQGFSKSYVQNFIHFKDIVIMIVTSFLYAVVLSIIGALEIRLFKNEKYKSEFFIASIVLSLLIVYAIGVFLVAGLKLINING